MITAPELARRLADQLESERIPYAIGGSLALGAWGFPRATNDVDVPCIPLYESARTRVAEAPLMGRPAKFLSAEDLATFKMLFFRSKDLVDLERLVAFCGGDFDDRYVRQWLADTVGEDDARVARWDQLVRDVADGRR